MTEQQLNQYLQDIDLKIMCLYYKTDAQGNQILDDNGNPINDYYQATANFMDIGEGWYQLMHDLLEELIKTDWDRDIHQIKEKFGGLRFYVGGASQEVFDIISRYEELSYETCEVCGETGKTRRDLGWHRTLCDKHYKEVVIKETQNYMESTLNGAMRSGLPILLKNTPTKGKYGMWKTNVYWEIPDYKRSENFDDVLECLKDCQTYINNMDKEARNKLRPKI